MMGKQSASKVSLETAADRGGVCVTHIRLVTYDGANGTTLTVHTKPIPVSQIRWADDDAVAVGLRVGVVVTSIPAQAGGEIMLFVFCCC
jgi:hypothetical protein